MEKIYFYGMRLRGFSPGAQPKGAFGVSDPTGKYYNILLYKFPLTDEEIKEYDLDYIGVLPEE